VRTANLLLASSSDPLIPLIFLGVALTVGAGIALGTRIVTNVPRVLRRAPAHVGIHHRRHERRHAVHRVRVPMDHGLAAYFGGQDIDFAESPEFSRAYRLRGSDEAAVRAVHPGRN
jgi:hypothetical protein